MPTLTITRGLPGSGKTTKALEWVAEDPARRARVNRDDLRTGVNGVRWQEDPGIRQKTELRITRIHRALIAELLKLGVDVVCDDTNLPQKVARELRRVADTAGAGFEIWDLTDIPVEVCLRRNASRLDDFVPEEVITSMYDRYIHGKSYPLPYPVEPATKDSAAAIYEPDLGARTAIMVDIDGTLALMGNRSPYDETRVGEDRPNLPVIIAVRAMHASGCAVVLCSGRTDSCREDTEKWLAEHVGVPYEALHMRAVGDQRKDAIVKKEIFDAHIRHQYNVVCVFDDRDQVVEAWRGFGLTVFQVAKGDF